MKNYTVITDSCSNLGKELRDKYGIEYVTMHYFIGEKEYDASCDWEGITAKDFYDTIRGGQRITSSNANAKQYEKVFTSAVENGNDVLCISCTSALSSSVNESYVARDAVLKKYPNAKIICVDSLNACGSLGLLVIKAAEMRNEGKTIEEVAAWAEEHKKNFNEVGTVDKLTYLKQAGRISATAAFFGGIFAVKPIVIYNQVGYNVAVEKVKGRKNSFEKLADYIVKYADLDANNNIFVAHADCLEEATEVGTTIQSKFPGKEINFIYGFIEQGVGASVGPGTIILGFYGNAGMRVNG